MGRTLLNAIRSVLNCSNIDYEIDQSQECYEVNFTLNKAQFSIIIYDLNENKAFLQSLNHDLQVLLRVEFTNIALYVNDENGFKALQFINGTESVAGLEWRAYD